MTSFVNDSGEYLDYPGEDFGITKQVASWHDFKIKGDISVDFKIPNTAKNRATLGFQGVSQISSPAFPSQMFSVVRNGNVIGRGNLAIKSVDDDQINLFYISGNSNWFNALKFNIKDMLFADSYTVSYKDLSMLSAATEGICFPLIDWGYEGEKRSSAFFLRPDRISVKEPTSQEVFPCIYMHSVLSQLCAEGGVKLGGDLKSDPLFKKILLTPSGPTLSCSDQIVKKTSVRLTLTADQAPAVDSNLTFDRVIEAGELVRYESGRYYAPFEGTYRIDLKTVWNTQNNSHIEVWKGHAAGGSDWYFSVDGTGVNNLETWVNLLAGDYVYFRIDLGGGAAPSLDSTTLAAIELEKEASGSRYALCVDAGAPTIPGLGPSFGYCISRILPSHVIPSMNATDFIKFLCIYFGAVCSYEEHSKTLNINKLDRIKREDAEDWSEYFVSQKTVFQTGAAQNNYILMAQGKEEQTVDYNLVSKLKYGGGVINSPFDQLEEKELFKLPFAGGWDELNKTRLESGVFLPYIKFYDFTDGDAWSYTAVTNNGGRASFTIAASHPFAKGDVVRVYSAGALYSGFGVVTSIGVAAIILEGVLYIASDSGTVVKQDVSPVDGPSRLLVARPSTSYTDFGFNAVPIFLYAISNESDFPEEFIGNDLYNTVSTFVGAWFDKPTMNLAIDTHKDSLAIDTIGNKTYNNTISERYHSTLENIYRNPKTEAYFLLPSSVFHNFNFRTFVYLKTEDVTGYFFVQKIDNYRDPVTPVKVELLSID